MSSQTNNTTLSHIIQKYNLDISIVEVNEIEWFTRIDSDFYWKDIINNERRIKSGKFELFWNIWTSKGGCAYSSWEFGNGAIRIAKITDVSQQNDIQKWETLSDSEFNRFPQNILQNWDILMSGTHHNAWDLWKVVFIEDLPLNEISTWNQRVFRLRWKENILKSECLYCLLQSKGIRLQIERYGRGNNQLNLNNEGIEALKVPLPSPTFQSQIAELVQKAYTQRELSKSLYSEAEKILLDELKLTDWKPSEVNISEKMSEEVELFGRCDAEFFQPKYDEVLEKIKKYKWWFDTIEKLILIAWKQMKIEADKEYQYCELADIDPGLWTVGNFTQIIWADLPSRARMKIEKWDVVVSSVAGSSQKVALIEGVDDNLVASTGFFILKPKAFNPETNLILMKSFFMQMFLERSARGMILSATNQDDFKNLIIPNIVKPIQEIIASKIIASHEAQKISKDLLEKAKRAVEIFIEEDEEVALKWLNS